MCMLAFADNLNLWFQLGKESLNSRYSKIRGDLSLKTILCFELNTVQYKSKDQLSSYASALISLSITDLVSDYNTHCFYPSSHMWSSLRSWLRVGSQVLTGRGSLEVETGKGSPQSVVKLLCQLSPTGGDFPLRGHWQYLKETLDVRTGKGAIGVWYAGQGC